MEIFPFLLKEFSLITFLNPYGIKRAIESRCFQDLSWLEIRATVLKFDSCSNSPVVKWQFKGRKLQPSAKYLIKEGELIVENLNYSDAGPYTCAARSILGSFEATGNLSVRGER